MSLLAVYVQILGVGTGTDNNIGMVDGDILWTSHEGQGIIDGSSLDGFGISCNIAQGGSLGAFYDEPSVIAYGTPLMEALKNRTISIVGKRMKVFYRTHGTTIADAVQRFDGLVGSWEIKNYIAVNIKCDSRVMFNNKVIPSITVTKDMTLGDDKSKAIGKSITTTYGNICDFPLVEVPVDNAFYSMLVAPEMFLGDVTPSLYRIMNGNAPMLDGSNQSLTASGKYKGQSLLQIFHKWQLSEKDNVWVALSINGESLFNGYDANIVENIKNAFIGMTIKVIRGTGEGNVFSIIGCEFATHDINEVSVSNVWFMLDTIEIGSVESAGGWNATYRTNDTANHTFNHKSSWAFNPLDTRLVAAYKNNEIREDVSYISFAGNSNIFIVSKDANYSASDITLIGTSQNESSATAIPVASVVLLYQTSFCSIIQIKLSNAVSSTSNDFTVNKFEEVSSKFVEPSSTAYAVNNHGVYRDPFLGIPDAVPTGDSISDMQNISYGVSKSGSFDATQGISELHPKFIMENSVVLPLNDLYKGQNLSNEVFSALIMPSVNYEVRVDSKPLLHDVNATCKLYVDVTAFDEGNLALGSVSAEETYEFSEFAYYGTSESYSYGGWFDILPDQGIIRFPRSLSYSGIGGIENFSGVVDSTYGTLESKTAFESLKSQLNISSILKVTSLKQIRYLVIRTRTVWTSDDPYTFFEDPDTNIEFRIWKKRIKNPYLGISKTLARDKLYLRTTRINTPQPQPTCPVDLVSTIAYENDVSIDSISFGTTQTKQRALFDFPTANFDGQYQPDDKTGVTDAISEIGKQSMTAFYPLRNGNLAALWFADKTDESETVHTFYGSQVVENSLSIDKKQGGYLYTDFVFDIIKNIYGSPEMMYVNTDSTLEDLPSSALVTSLGSVIGPDTNWELYRISGTTSYCEMRIRSTQATSPALLLFVEGSRWLLTNSNGLRIVAILASVAPDPQCPLDATGARVVFQFEASLPTDQQTMVSIQSYGPIEDWKNYVSGTFVTDYTTARNIWEHAQAARKLLGVERAMPDTVTKLTDPVWGSDDRALMQWVLYTVIWATREKSILKFKVEANDATNVLWVLDYVEFAWGPYASTPAKGYIVEIADLTNEGLFEITILTCKPESEMLLTLDERFAQNDMTIDERDADNNYTLNEGSLA